MITIRDFRILFAAAALACTAVSFAAPASPEVISPTMVNTPGCRAPDYPQRSLDLEREGIAIAGMLVLPDGRLGRAIILHSSGYPELDQALLDAVTRCGHKAGTEDGKPVEMWNVLMHKWTVDRGYNDFQLQRRLTAAKAKGNRDASFHLSLLLQWESKTDADRQRAFAELRNAADLGQPMAQFFLGRRYEQGNGVTVDVEEALRWYEKAAAQDNVLAVQRLRQGALPSYDSKR